MLYQRTLCKNHITTHQLM